MTSLLEKAFEVASKLPTLEQNILARTLLDEIKSEKRWDELFAESEDILAQLAAEALREEDQGKTTDLDPRGNRGQGK
jgi:hypothetical protein